MKSTTPTDLTLQLEQYVREFGCLEEETRFDERLRSLTYNLYELAMIEPSAIDFLGFRDQRIPPLLRRIDSIRAHIQLTQQ